MNTLAFGIPGGLEWFAIALVGLLIFGKRLPEVGRSLGRSIVEFKKGIKGVHDEIEAVTEPGSYNSERLPGDAAPAPAETTSSSSETASSSSSSPPSSSSAADSTPPAAADSTPSPTPPANDAPPETASST